MCTNFSTPLQMYNSSFSPIIPTSQELNETSFHSIVSQTIPELPQNKKKCISKRVYHFLVLLGLLSCLSLLIYVTIHVSIYMNLSGGIESNVTIPSIGSFNVSLQAKEVLFNVSSQLNSNLKVGSESSEPPSEMWKQVYLDDLLL